MSLLMRSAAFMVSAVFLAPACQDHRPDAELPNPWSERAVPEPAAAHAAALGGSGTLVNTALAAAPRPGRSLAKESAGSRRPAPESEDGPPADAAAIEAIEWYFERQNEAEKARLLEEMAHLDRASYQSFIERNALLAKTCAGLDPSLLAKIDAYRAADNNERRSASLAAIREAARAGSSEQRECVAARTTRLGKDNMFLSGLLALDNDKNEPDLRPTVPAAGSIYLLAPQILTAWPGKPESATRILDPADGPWRVEVASTFLPVVETFSMPWMREDDVMVADFLELRKRADHYLILDNEGSALGWLNAGRCAFYHELWNLAARYSKTFFTKGVASKLQGIYYRPGAKCDPDDIDACPTFYVYDFLSLMEGELHTYSPTRMHTSRMREFYIEPDLSPPKDFFSVRMEENYSASRTSWDGFDFQTRKIHIHKPPNAAASLILTDMTHLPLERLTSLR